MASLQNKFQYEGDSSNSPIESVLLFFDIPTYKFETILRDGRPFPERVHLGAHTLQVHRALNSADYLAPFASELLIGSTDLSVKNFHAYYAATNFVGDDASLASLSTNIRLHIKDELENGFGESAFDALYSFSTASERYADILARQRALNTSVAFNEDEADKLTDELIDYLRGNIFLVNRERFDEAAAQFRAVEPRFNDFAFLLILSHVTDVTRTPQINIAPDEFKTYLKVQFGIGDSRTIKTLQKVLKDELFDFPVVVPEITSVEIKGTFTLLRADSAPMALTQFRFYDLATEYSVRAPDGNSGLITNHFDWSAVQQPADNTVPFSFGAVITNLIGSDVDVRVKAYDGSVVWERQYAVSNPSLANIAIEVPLVTPVVLGDPGPKPTGGHKKLSGKVVELSTECDLKDIVVVVEAQKAQDAPRIVVGSATTDNSGNFSMPFPYGDYVAARAFTSLAPASPVDIPVYTDEAHVSVHETIADDFLYLLLKDVTCENDDEEEQEDCECHDLDKANRLPSQADLIQSDSYTQDIGGSCVNLSVPNRTLNEYRHKAVVRTSDPDVANYVLTRDSNGNFLLEGGLSKITRKPVDLGNPIRWQDAPDDRNNLSLYQAVTVATGHVLHYSVTTKADGYSLGELLHSMPLAPGQKKQIVVFEQTHTLTGSETQRVSQRESLAASLVNDVDITDTLAGNLSESTGGGSSATTGGVSAGLGLAGIVKGIAGAFGVSGGFANANSTAWQDSSRALSEHFHEQIKNSINQNAQSYRELNASVVTTVQEGQNYGVTAEVIANHNHCHSLTMMYFEVLKHYAIYQELIHVEECLFIPLLMTDFTRENIFKWRDVLADNLLPMSSETYLQPFTLIRAGRQHPLLRGFDAIERINTNYENVDFPQGAYDDEVMNFITGEIYLYTNLPRPKSKYDRIKSWPLEKKSTWSWPGALIGGILGGPLGLIAGGYLNADGGVKAEAHPIIDEYIYIDANFASVPPAQCIRVRKFDGNFFETGGFDKAQWEAYATVLGKDVGDMLGYYFKDRLISEWDSIFYNDIAPVLFEHICENISVGGFSAIDLSAETKYKGNYALMKVNLRGTGSNKKRNEISQLALSYANTAALTNDLATLSVRNVTIRYSTAHYNGVIYSGYVGDGLVDGSLLSTPENANEKRNPKKEDAYIAAKLVAHLNSNLEHYNKALFKSLDPDRRIMLLDGFIIETYNDFGAPIGKRALASVVKNDLVGVSGNALIMPVAPGYKVDRSFVVEQPIEGPATVTSLFDHYKPLTPIPPYRVSIPSKGVFAEAVQGACDACEKVKENTSQDWEKFKTDEPTSINPVTVPVPTVTDWKAAFKDFATPIVNIQNAPPTPAPGAGLAAATELLGKSGIFKDITGLDQNQKNAMQTYLSNQENAKAFAEMAKEIFMTGHNTEHSDKIADSIRNSPELSKEEKAQLLKDHFEQMIDGGQTKKDAQNSKPTLTDAAVKAADQGKAVKATSADASGNSASVDISAGAESENVLAEVKGYIQILQQATDNACWATAATIMMSWKNGVAQNVQDVLRAAGNQYLQLFTDGKSLPSNMKSDFIAKLGMIGEPPASYLLQKYINWVTHGPVWITTDSSDQDGVFTPHARILVKITGTGTPDGIGTYFTFIDPAIGALSAPQPYNDFLKVYDQMVTDNPGSLFIPIVHFPDANSGEGAGGNPAPPAAVANSVLGFDMDAGTGGALNLASFVGLKTLGKRFGIHKLGQFTPDQHFDQNYSRIREAGMIRGSYDFFSSVAVATHVQWVVDHVKRLGPGDLAPAIDLEDQSGNLDGKYHYSTLPNNAGRLALFKDVQRWLDDVETKLGRTPMVYTGVLWRENFTPARVPDAADMSLYPLWTAHPQPLNAPANPQVEVYPSWRDYTIWQYAEDTRGKKAKNDKAKADAIAAGLPPPAGLDSSQRWGRDPYVEPGTEAFDGIDYDTFNGSLYSLRGLAEIGRPGLAIGAGGIIIAHADKDDTLHLISGSPASQTDISVSALTNPNIGGDPAAILSAGVLCVYFRQGDTIVQWVQNDANQSAMISGGHPAIHDPRALAVANDRYVVYWGDDNEWYLLKWDGSAWASPQGVLTAAGLFPTNNGATGQPAVYADAEGAIHVVGRVFQEGHLVDVKNDGASGWTADEVTDNARISDPNFPAATYSPFVYSDTSGQFIVFRAVRGDLWSLTMAPATAKHQSANLTQASGGVACIGHPSGFVLNDIPHIVYRGVDKLIHEIWLDGLTWKTRSVCAAEAAADPVASANATAGAVAFRTVNGAIQLAQFSGASWSCAPAI